MKDSIQMVDEDQVENVGIMSGFMDDLEGLLEELSAEEMEGMEEGDEADMARMMGRSPDSPEILMNNLRGDMRSIDARREELSDLVGFREAEETPEGVLALLQPVLGQQAAPMPPQGMPPMMPPQGMPPMPPQGMPPMMPPQGMPPQQLAAGGPVGYADGGSTLPQSSEYAQAQAIADARAQAIADAQAQAIADARAQAIADARAQADAKAQAQAIADARAQADAKAQGDARAMPPQGTPVYDPNTGALIGMSYANENLPAGFPAQPPMGARESMPISPDDAAIRDLLLQQGQEVAPPVAGPATGGIGSLAPPVAPVGGINDGGIMRRMQEEQQRRRMEEQRRMVEEQQRRMMEEQRPMMPPMMPPMMEEQPPMMPPMMEEQRPMMPPYDPRTGGIGTPMPPADIGYDYMPPEPPLGLPVSSPVNQRPVFMPQNMQQGMPPPDSGVGALFGPQQAPRFMADGGMVQHFQDGSDAAGVTPSGTYSPEIVAEVLRRMQGSSVPTIQEGMDRNLPMYQELLGSDPKDTQAQMLFDIAQAALGYAGNVGPDGQPLRGSAAARLAGATRELPGRIGQRAAGMSKEAQALKMAALQQAQRERSSAQALEVERRKNQVRPMTEDEKIRFGITGEEALLPWIMTETGPKVAGGRSIPPDPSPFQDPYLKTGREKKFEKDDALYTGAQSSVGNLAKLDEVLRIVEKGDINTGIGSDIASNFNRLKAKFLGDERAGSIAAQNEYLDSLLGSDVFTAIGALGIGARGLDTPAERDFLIQVMTGSRKLDAEALKAMTQFRKIREIKMMERYNSAVESGAMDEYFALGNERKLYEIPEMPVIDLSPIARMNTETERNAALAASIEAFNAAKAASIRSQEEIDAAAAAARGEG